MTYKYPCSRCGKLLSHNPEDPPPPHNKPDSDEVCVTEEEWRMQVSEALGFSDDD